MWSIAFSRSAKGCVSVTITFRLLLISPAPGNIPVRGHRISDNLDAYRNFWDANRLRSPEILHKPAHPCSKAQHPVRMFRCLRKDEILHGIRSEERRVGKEC